MSITDIIVWIVLGLIAGAIAKFIVPGRQGGGIVMTIILGIVGAIIGGFIGSLLGLGSVSGLNLGSIILAIVGAIIVIFAVGALQRG